MQPAHSQMPWRTPTPKTILQQGFLSHMGSNKLRNQYEDDETTSQAILYVQVQFLVL
jgi:hypothetical protein